MDATPDPRDVFRPLADASETEGGTAGPAPRSSSAKASPAIMPAPLSLPATIRHRDHGSPSRVWRYLDAAGAVLFLACRFDKPDGGKEVLPYVCAATRWRWGAPPSPRPLYHLDALADAPDAPVLIVEGEKAADAATLAFPDHVAMTWQGGSNAVAFADWSALAARAVTVWPDNDAAGRKAAGMVARALAKAGAASVAVVDVPGDWPDGWDVADPLPEGVTPEALRAMLAEAGTDTAADDDGAEDEEEATGHTTDPLAALRADVTRAAAIDDDEYALARRDMARRHGVSVATLDARRAKRQREDAAAERSRRAEEAGPAPETDGRGRARLFLDGADLPDVAQELGRHLGRVPYLFVRGRPVRLITDDTGAPVADLLTVEGVIAEAHRVTRPWQYVRGKGGVMEEAPVTLPDRVGRLYLADPAAWNLRPLAGIAAAPLLHDDGTIHGAEGYDPRSRMWCRPVPPLDVPAKPSRDDAARALLILRRHLRTFPFADADRVAEGPLEVVDTSKPPRADESAALAALLTAVCRPSLSRAPAVLMRAPPYSGAGSGKGLLTRAICAVAFGASPSAMTPGSDAAELDKRLTAALIGAAPVLFLDNVNASALRSDLLASAITENPAEVRRLGKSEVVRLNPSAFVAVTGNGVRLSEDLARRFLTVELDARTEDPEARPFTGDKEAETLAARAGLLSAALTVWRWGRQQGDALARGKPMGSFGTWARWCRDPLLALGCADPAERIAAAKASDPRRQMLAELFAAWWAAHGNKAVALSDLAEPARTLADPHGRGRHALQARVSGLDGTRAAGFVLTRIPKSAKWAVDHYVLAPTGRAAEPAREAPDRDPRPNDGGQDEAAPDVPREGTL